VNLLTSSVLFVGNKYKSGSERCYYCGAYCSDENLTSFYVKETFTNRDIIKFPNSKYVCVGCVESLGNGYDEMKMVDGSIKKRDNERGMQPRMYSWIITKGNKLAATKAHIKELRKIILNPPEIPFSIILADSGQKQLIFRCPVNIDKNNFSLLLEDEVIENIDVNILNTRIEMIKPIVFLFGKLSLLKKFNISHFAKMNEYFDNISIIEKWIEIKNEPISRLAVWLSYSKEELKNEYIKRGRI